MFLPDNRPLPINAKRTLRDPGGLPLAPSGDSSWIPYNSTSTLPFLMDPHNKPFEAFDSKTRRHPQDSLSIFSLLVNANSKLQAVRGESCDSILEHYASITERVVEEIFHVRQDSDIAEDRSNLDIKFIEPEFEESKFEEPKYDSERNDEPGMVNGLTPSEMDTILERVSDSRISDRERADAAMLMLGMAGGELSLLFATFRSLPDTKHQALGIHSRSLRYSKIICKTSLT